MLELCLDDQVVEAALRIHPQAWWDGEHLRKKVADPAAMAEFCQLLRALPKGFQVRLHDWKKIYWAAQATPHELELARFDRDNFEFVEIRSMQKRQDYVDLLEATYRTLGFLEEFVYPKPEATLFEGDARRRLEALAIRGGVSGRVLTFLAARLKGAVPPLSEVASALAMSERSIQRSLSEEQTSYRELVDEVRKNLAIEHLSRPGTSATDVSFLLGFSEPSAFTRAFRRWTGLAPTSFRGATN